MNCIFLCVFNEKKYVDICFLLLESLFIYGNIDNNTDILIYTSTLFMNMIKESHLFNDKIKFLINDTYNDIAKSRRSRLYFFNLPLVNNYDKILYLDTDIIVKDDINKVFDVCKEEILYVLEEGSIDNDADFWGKSLFKDEEILKYEDKTAFTTGIMLFKNCQKIKHLFDQINKDILIRYRNFLTYEQPFIVYNAFKYNLYNNKELKSFVANNDIYIHSDKIIHHFPGIPGFYQRKIDLMSTFLNDIKEFTINNNITKTKKYIDNYLLPIIKDSGANLEGNIFMLHSTIEYTDLFINKVKNISNVVLNKNIKNVMEIGFNAGFSTLLMLLSNPNIHITCFDIGWHAYTMPCYANLKERFGDRINIIIGDSTKTLPNIDDKYDLIHIDGSHVIHVAESDIIHSYRLSKERTIIIMDDYDGSGLHELWDNYVVKYNLKPLQIKLYDSLQHDIKYVQ